MLTVGRSLPRGLLVLCLALQGCAGPPPLPGGSGVITIGDRSEPSPDVPDDVVPTDNSEVRPDVAAVDSEVPPDVSPTDSEVRPDAAPIDSDLRPDVAAIDASLDRPDVAAIDAAPDVRIDRPDTAVVDVGIDRLDAAVVDVGVDRPDVTVIDVGVDRPDVTVIDVGVDRPDVTVVDVGPDRPDVAVDRPPAVDIGPDAPPLGADPVTYSGTFAARTDGSAFRASLTVLGHRRDVWVQMPARLGPSPALMLAFHGTNGDGQVILMESGVSAFVASQNVIVIAPSSRWFGSEGADFDHAGGDGTYWETSRNANPDTNEDLLLVRAIIQEARRSFGVDPRRVYAYGHSNGGFMAYMVAQVLRARVVGFAENSAGLSRCYPQQACRFRGRGTTCAELATRAGWCSCTGAELPVALPTTGRLTPGLLLHGTDDPLVSVYHTCTLESLMRARGYPVSTTLFDGGGHGTPATLVTRAWTYLSAFRLP